MWHEVFIKDIVLSYCFASHFLCIQTWREFLDVEFVFLEPSLGCEVFDEKMFGRLTFPQLLFASLLGIAGGIYIYQPIFEQYSRDQKELKEKMKLVQDSEEKKSWYYMELNCNCLKFHWNYTLSINNLAKSYSV